MWILRETCGASPVSSFHSSVHSVSRCYARGSCDFHSRPEILPARTCGKLADGSSLTHSGALFSQSRDRATL